MDDNTICGGCNTHRLHNEIWHDVFGTCAHAKPIITGWQNDIGLINIQATPLRILTTITATAMTTKNGALDGGSGDHMSNLKTGAVAIKVCHVDGNTWSYCGR